MQKLNIAMSILAAAAFAVSYSDAFASTRASTAESAALATRTKHKTLVWTNVSGPSCHSSDPQQICLGVKVVSYTDGNGIPSASEDLMRQNFATVNNVWSRCKIGFQMESYFPVAPGQYGLSYGGQSQNEVEQIRKTFDDSQRLLVVMTGPWPGTIKNAWTAMPGDPVNGSVLEAGVSDYPMILAHELGHYLGLEHVVEPPQEVPLRLMNWKIYTNSTATTDSECATARDTASRYWKAMLR